MLSLLTAWATPVSAWTRDSAHSRVGSLPDRNAHRSDAGAQILSRDRAPSLEAGLRKPSRTCRSVVATGFGALSRHSSVGVLEKDMAATKAALIDEAQRAVEVDGAEAIIFGCTGLMGCAGSVYEGLLARGIDIPVVDPIPTAVNIAAALVRSRLSHSSLTYPLPPVKAMPGYEFMPNLHLKAAE